MPTILHDTVPIKNYSSKVSYVRDSFHGMFDLRGKKSRRIYLSSNKNSRRRLSFRPKIHNWSGRSLVDSRGRYETRWDAVSIGRGWQSDAISFHPLSPPPSPTRGQFAKSNEFLPYARRYVVIYKIKRRTARAVLDAGRRRMTGRPGRE